MFAFFILLSFGSTIFRIYFYDLSDIFIVLAYLFRFINYVMFGFLIYNAIKSKILPSLDIHKILKNNFYLLTTLNIVQYLFFRDISSLAVFGFDPHQTRLTGTFLDPNFMGIFLVLYFIYSEIVKNSKFISISSFVMILLTESRSAILTLGIVLVFLVFKNIKYSFYFLIIMGFTFFTPFFARVELSKASNDSSNLRIESWKNGINLWQFSPEFGVGFNNYKNMSKYFNLLSPEQFSSNSANSSDSSLISVLAMTGILGLVAFCLFLLSFLSSKSFYFLVAIFINSLFINSLFFPAVCVYLFLWLNITRLQKV